MTTSSLCTRSLRSQTARRRTPHIIGANDDEFRMIYLAGDGSNRLTPGSCRWRCKPNDLARPLTTCWHCTGRPNPNAARTTSRSLCVPIFGSSCRGAKPPTSTPGTNRRLTATVSRGTARRTADSCVRPIPLDILFVFDHLEKAYGMRWMLGDNLPGSLAVAMQDAWIRFARTGDPGWPAWGPDSRQVMRWDTEPAVADDPKPIAHQFGARSSRHCHSSRQGLQPEAL